jgi:methyl-accepting chemotaxis protein
LNASFEAATRARRQRICRVANEVKNLAETTQAEAKEDRSLCRSDRQAFDRSSGKVNDDGEFSMTAD